MSRFFRSGPAPRAFGLPRAGGGVLANRPGLTRGMRVGLFGGSFNPAHEGHLHVARTALVRLDLDRVMWLVSPGNPLKPARDAEAFEARLASGRAVARGPSMIVSDFEARAGFNRTVQTLRALRRRYPAVRFVWIMGSDNLADFHRWRGWTEILRLVPAAVIARPGSLLKSRLAPAARRFARHRRPAAQARLLPFTEPPAWVYLRAPLNPASSTAIRRQRPGDPAAGS